MFNWFKKKKKVDPDEMWRILRDEPDPDYLENMIKDVMNGKDPDENKFGKYLRYLARAVANEKKRNK